jgi:xanthine dehydrogenase accessory factor
VYDIAVPVAACLRSGTRVDLAWVVDSDLRPAPDLGQAVGLTPGGGRLGSLLDGVLDDRLSGVRGRVDLAVAPADRLDGTRVSCLVVGADTLPGDLWSRLVARDPVALVTRGQTTAWYDGDDHDVLALIACGRSGRIETDGGLVSVFAPTPRLAILGGGAIVEAIARIGEVLGWSVQSSGDTMTIAGQVASFTAADMVLVAHHDLDAAGSVLAEALDGDAGYVAALGSAKMRAAREAWLADRGITDLARLHTPAGLSIGASTPAETAVAVIAEAIAVRSGG